MRLSVAPASQTNQYSHDAQQGNMAKHDPEWPFAAEQAGHGKGERKKQAEQQDRPHEEEITQAIPAPAMPAASAFRRSSRSASRA